MATLTIRGLDDEIRERLRVRAAQHGQSMEAEVRAILRDHLAVSAPAFGLASRMHARFIGIGVDLDPPVRDEAPRAAVFEE
jgi:plasmid stability protein